MADRQFRNQSFAGRFAAMGDEAEGVFEAVYPEGFVRFGINRPPINLANVPAKIRYTPDFLTGRGLVEVQGFGKDQILKLKHDKLNALWAWHEDFRVDLFVWDSTNKEYGWVRLPELDDAITAHAVEAMFPENKPYWALHSMDIPVIEWLAHE